MLRVEIFISHEKHFLTTSRDELLVTKRQFDKADATIKEMDSALQTANTQR